MNAIPRSEYPRPQFVRADWLCLNGEWSCEIDQSRSGIARGLQKSTGFATPITVPFCPESRLSGIAHTDFIRQIFYHKRLTIPAAWQGRRIMINFGGVDYECEGFVNGESVGRHFGGSTSFSFDLTDRVKPGESCDFVLRVGDDINSGFQMRGKQCPDYKSRGCCYTRVTGIWQSVWLEPVAETALRRCRITPDFDNRAFVFNPEFYRETRGRKLAIRILAEGKTVGETVIAGSTGGAVSVPVAGGRAWSPADPFLYDIEFAVIDADGKTVDRVDSYAGMRKFHFEGDRCFLNNEPFFLRLVLDQGFYEDGIWTAPSDEALKRDIELSQAVGFNGARLHQKVFEERFHYWADKLGYLTWGETPSWGVDAFAETYGMTPPANFHEGIWRFLSEWRRIIERDVNHPSIIVWTPLNEAIPGKNLALYREVIDEIYAFTKQVDPTRPCNTTCGYTHSTTDIWSVHCYSSNRQELIDRLFPADGGVFAKPNCIGYHGQPYMNTEFGGYMFIPPDRRTFADNSWGYYKMRLESGDDLCKLIAEQVKVMVEDPRITGFCYTQLTDIEQEQNGVLNYDRTPKAPIEKLRAAFTCGKRPDGC